MHYDDIPEPRRIERAYMPVGGKESRAKGKFKKTWRSRRSAKRIGKQTGGIRCRRLKRTK